MDSYMEYMVKKTSDSKDVLKKGFGIAGVVVIAFLAFYFDLRSIIGTVFLILAIAMYFVCKNFIFPASDLEYEYLYCDKSITVDKIMGKEKRKNLGVYDVDKFEILCPEKSWRCSDFKNRQFDVHDYTGHAESKEHEPYVLIYDGKQKILLDLPVEFVKLVQNNAPRKVFLD